MTFTEEDAQNDGLIKREVGREMAKVAKTHNPEVFDHFQNVCDEIGRTPADVFGEMAVRCLDSEQFAERVLSSEINMRQLKADEIRLEDVKYVKQLSDELGLDEQQTGQDPIDQLIDKRLQSITRSPVPRLNEQNTGQGGNEGQIAEYMEKMEQRLQQMEQAVAENDNASGDADSAQDDGDNSIDDLFGSDGEGEDNSGDEAPEEKTMEAPEPEEDEEPSDEEIEEAVEGTGIFGDEEQEDEGSAEQEEKHEQPNISDDVEKEGPFSSMRGEEE